MAKVEECVHILKDIAINMESLLEVSKVLQLTFMTALPYSTILAAFGPGVLARARDLHATLAAAWNQALRIDKNRILMVTVGEVHAKCIVVAGLFRAVRNRAR